jgi:NDP-sugar pyrophosphorylase family protein
MKIYAEQGFDEFTIALGYKGDVIKRDFFDLGTTSSSMETTTAWRPSSRHS